MKSSLNKLFPPGWEKGREIWGYVAALGFLLLFSFRYLLALDNALDSLYTWKFGKKILIEDVQMESINTLLKGSMWGFWLLVIDCAVQTVSHYRSFYTDSKSIYTMKRLSSPAQLHRRCLAMPLTALLTGILLTALLLWLYILLYYHKTPPRCLLPKEALDIWRVLL